MSFSSDDPTIDLKKISDVYESMEDIALNLDYKVFEDHFSSIPKETERGLYFRKGKNEFSELLGVTTVQFENEKVFINKDEKIIILTDFVTMRDSSFLGINFFISSLDKIGTLNKKIISKSSSCLSINYGSEKIPYKVIEIFYNPKTFLMSKAILYYREKMSMDDSSPKKSGTPPRVEILFTNIDQARIKESDVFNYSNYIVRSGKKLLAGTKYKGFEIVNQKKTRK